MLKINNVDKYFNRFKRNKIHVINHTTIETDNTGLVALLGPSGCGKTTLLNVIGGLDKVGKGKICASKRAFRMSEIPRAGKHLHGQKKTV